MAAAVSMRGRQRESVLRRGSLRHLRGEPKWKATNKHHNLVSEKLRSKAPKYYYAVTYEQEPECATLTILYLL
jgi:hypothetical protein